MRVELLEYSVKKNSSIQLNIADLSMTIWFLFVCLFSFIHSVCYLVHFRFSHRCQRSEKRSQNAIPKETKSINRLQCCCGFYPSNWFGNTRKKRAKNRITEEKRHSRFLWLQNAHAHAAARVETAANAIVCRPINFSNLFYISFLSLFYSFSLEFIRKAFNLFFANTTGVCPRARNFMTAFNATL